MTNIATEIARRLLQIKAIKLNPQNPFTWASGILSPIYCDNRIILSYPNHRDFLKKSLAQLAPTFDDFDTIAGVATAGIPYGTLLADALHLPFCYVRSQAKSHGRQNQIEGNLQAGQRVLVVEDLISTGGSSLKAVEAIREAGAEVVGVIAIFSYDFAKAKKAFQDANCPFKTLTDYNQLLELAVQENYISSKDMDSLHAWRQAPEQWKP